MKRLRILRLLAPALVAVFVAGPVALSSSAKPIGAPSTALVFANYRNSLSEINAIESDGSGKRQLTTAQPSFQGQPAYSPDGSKIAYICGNFELCVMNADGSGEGRLTTSRWPQRWEYVDHPSWSADGTEIAFASNSDGRFHVYVINADGTGLHKLPGTSWNDDDPAWSPDGTKIAFDRYRSWSAGTSAIYVMNADGTQPRQLSPSGLNAWGPSWSPDGSKITFSGYPGDYAHLLLMNAGGGGKQQLTRGLCEETDPAWSPDGSGLAFERNCGRRLGIAVGKFGGRIVRITAPQHGFDLYPAWRPTATGGGTATPIGPASTATGDARLAGRYFQWEIQVLSIDYFAANGVRVERRIRADDLHAVAALRAARPETAKGKLLQRTATAAFRLDAAAARQFLLSYRAAAHRKTKAAAKYNRAGGSLAGLAERKFNAADNVAELPY